MVDGSATYTVYDGENAWADFNGAGLSIARYLAGPNTDELLARFRPGEGTSWYLTDHLGTIRDIVNAAGVVVDHVIYDSFGNVIFESNPSKGDRFKFVGREFDPETVLYFFRARYYDPSLGRFISEDPLGPAAGDLNLYLYALNNPIGLVDPTGLDPSKDQQEVPARL